MSLVLKILCNRSFCSHFLVVKLIRVNTAQKNVSTWEVSMRWRQILLFLFTVEEAWAHRMHSKGLSTWFAVEAFPVKLHDLTSEPPKARKEEWCKCFGKLSEKSLKSPPFANLRLKVNAKEQRMIHKVESLGNILARGLLKQDLGFAGFALLWGLLPPTQLPSAHT